MSVLQRFAQRANAQGERCDLCSEQIPEHHRHLLESDARSVACVCQGCALLFASPAASRGKYRLIPDRLLRLVDFTIGDMEWTKLQVPVGICFVTGGRALYPGVMGLTEAVLEPTLWSTLAMGYPLLDSLQTDLEALLINRARGAQDYFIAPIDTCFSLVGLVRTHWRGLSGGSAVWTEIDTFFETLRKRARTQTMEATACPSATT
jgi:Family of unknown function (DUF5947)